VRVLGFPLLLPDRVGPLEVRQHHDVEQLGAWSRPRAASRSRVGAPVRRSARPGRHPPGPVYAVGALWANREGGGPSV
jgi:hypothetical protein